MAEATVGDRGVRLQAVNLPAASPFVNPDSAYHWPRREGLDAGDVPLDEPCRCARTNAGGVIGREGLDAGTVASGAGSSQASQASAPP
jgi:hypothetical protein